MTRPLNILYHHRTQGRGAEGNHIVSIVTALRADGHTVDVVSPPGVDPFDPAATVPVDKARAQTQGWSSLWKFFSKRLPNWVFELAEILYNLPAYLRLRRALRARQYDLVFERYAFYLLAGAWAARRAGVSFLLEANEVSGIPNRARRQSFPRLCAAFERHLIRRLTLAHCVSSYLGDRLADAGLDRRRIAVVPNGFDLARIRTARERGEVRASLGFGPDDIVIGFAGWFDRWDRLDFLVDIFDGLRREHPVKLCLVGAGPAAAEAQARIAGRAVAPHVVFTGAVPRAQVYEYINCFDIGVLPHSNVFGSPIVMFEMMGLGIPLALPSLPPILDVHGSAPAGRETALLFTPLDAAGCSAALARLAGSPSLRREIAERAFALLRDSRTWRHTAREILDAWQRAADLSG
jgi:glycosyltransferase involved in cell wall biosynthesis